MMYDHHIYHRQSIRLRDYDYSQEGAYFVTMCIRNWECCLGNINDGKMQPNDIGKMIEKWWQELPKKFPNIEIDEYMVMPNHFHGIIIIVGANLCVCPNNKGNDTRGGHIGPPLHRMIQWFKTMTTNEYIRGIKIHSWPPFIGKFWQRNYYERVIRNDIELNKLREYIIANPQMWDSDEENPCKIRDCVVNLNHANYRRVDKYVAKADSRGRAEEGCGIHYSHR